MKDRDAPTPWRYEDGKPVPRWHALSVLESHWRFGYRDYVLGKTYEVRNTNESYAAAQLAGFEAARTDDRVLCERAQAYAAKALEDIERAAAQDGGPDKAR